MGRGIIVDLFAGGGGASLGIELATGRSPDIALNHDPIAIEAHRTNHPTTRHLEADVWSVRPRAATGGRPVELLWASPDCTHFSIAKGGKPRKQDIRSLAWVVVRWASEVRPQLIVVENVREFLSWGPLNAHGRPCKRLRGEEFSRWVEALEAQGYAVDWRVLDASEFGAPTRRKRLFVIARLDGRRPQWPEPTHGEGRLALRPASECIDWSIPCPSIFERRRPLAEKTQWRIAQGIRRFVIETEEPFIVPAPAAALLIQTGYGERPGQRARALEIRDPLGTVVAGGQKHALVLAWLAKHFGGVVGNPLEDPASTITTRDHHALATTHLLKLRGECHSADPREPMPTVTAQGGHLAEVRAFLTKYYGCGTGQALTEPAHTITARQRFGLVAIAGLGDFQVVDVGMRMLEPHELLRAQFGEHADGYTLDVKKRVRGRTRPLSKADKVRLIGNSVCPHVAAAVIRAQHPAMEAAA